MRHLMRGGFALAMFLLFYSFTKAAPPDARYFFGWVAGALAMGAIWIDHICEKEFP